MSGAAAAARGYCGHNLSSVCARSSASLGQEVRLAAMLFGNSEMDVPEGQMKIAQRFNAGRNARPEQVPKGRLKDGTTPYAFSRPFGTQILPTSFPALKRQATLELSLRDSGSRYDPGISERHSGWPRFYGKLACREGFFRVRISSIANESTRLFIIRCASAPKFHQCGLLLQ